MIRIMINGCNGYMGRVLDEIIAKEEQMKIVAGIDLEPNPNYAYPVYDSIAACDVSADVLIDFTIAKITDMVLDQCVAKKLPVVLCTTGLSREQLEHVEAASKEIPVLQSYNMSLGIQTLSKVLEQITPLLADAGFDIEIVEKHHNKKLDAPSGTAILLADAANKALDYSYHTVFDRSERRQQRDPKEIGISAVRGGTIVGVHDVIFAGEDEVIELHHQAYSKSVFAKGAVQAAKFLVDKGCGLYNMRDVVSN